jgi:hypothetical protein
MHCTASILVCSLTKIANTHERRYWTLPDGLQALPSPLLVAVTVLTISDLARRHKQERVPWQVDGLYPNQCRGLGESTQLHLYLAVHSSGSMVHTASDPVGGAAFGSQSCGGRYTRRGTSIGASHFILALPSERARRSGEPFGAQRRNGVVQIRNYFPATTAFVRHLCSPVPGPVAPRYSPRERAGFARRLGWRRLGRWRRSNKTQPSAPWPR